MANDLKDEIRTSDMLRRELAPQTAWHLSSRIGRFWALPWLEKTQGIAGFYWLLKTQFYYRCFFGGIGRRSKIFAPMRFKNVRYIFIGDNVLINKLSFLLTAPLNNAPAPKLIVGDGCVIGHMNHITCVNQVIIGNKVLTADRVHISDNSHGFADPYAPIIDQEIVTKGPVRIGNGTWIGENASILSCSIGRNCVIGANAVVIHDIPDYCVAVGAPARVIRRLNPTLQSWEKGNIGG